MAEAARSIQIPAGYDEEFLHEVEDDYLCLICQLPLREPVQTRCGHRFCDACLEAHLRRQGVQKQPFTCPADKKGLDRDRDVFPDNATGRKILSFMIKCPSEGCLWTGKLRDKEGHLESCPFKVVSCTNKNCEVIIKRKDLDQHVTNTCEWRIIECEHCGQLRPKCHLQGHLMTCRKFPLPCPNSCGDKIPRKMISNHIDDDCPLTLISCPYAHMGCIEKFQRQSKDSHLQSATREHLDFACVKLNRTQVQLDATQTQLTLIQDQLGKSQETTRKLGEKLEALQKRLEEKVNNQEATQKLEGKLEALQKQLEMKTKTDKEAANTRFIWKINKFSEILRQAKTVLKKTTESRPFYTGCYGYKFKLFALPQYHDVIFDEYLPVGIVLLQGEYDDMLPWPFRKNVAFTLIDQNEDLKERLNIVKDLSPDPLSKAFFEQSIFVQRPREHVTPKGQILLTTHATLQTRRYLVNDTLFLQVDIDPND